VRRCTACGETKPLTEFGRDRRRADGYALWCKICRNAYFRERYHRNLEQNRAKKRAYVTATQTAETRAARVEWARKWRQANPEKARE
jgi:hypothetical protein